jgi:hypothetical protein
MSYFKYITSDLKGLSSNRIENIKAIAELKNLTQITHL